MALAAITPDEVAPTPEQSAILASSGNLMIEALAGTGKSATLKLIEAAQPPDPILFLAFNKKIATDAEKTVRSTTQVRTLNGLGHRVWASAIGRKVVINGRKTQDLVREYLNEQPRHLSKELWPEFWTLVEAVNRAKTIGYIPKRHGNAVKALSSIDDVEAGLDEQPSDLGLVCINEVLMRGIQRAYSGECDFADQVYMPTLFTGTFPTFPLVLVDEYQDLNPLNHVMIRKLARKARLIGVGDPHQNIYGFRGAVAGGMSLAVAEHAMATLPLSLSFRCPEAIVRGVHWHVPHMRWSRPGGTRTSLLNPTLASIPDDAAVLCRNNAPLFALAMRLLGSGRSVNVSGSDIGPKVVATLKKLGDESMPRASLLAAIDDWLTVKLDAGSTTAEDTAECMRVFARAGDNLTQALMFADHLFKQSGSITLCTGHKSKGLEWPDVFHLDPFLCARPEDANLRYVIETRSSNHYTELNSNRIGE